MRIVLDLQGAQGTNRDRGIGRYTGSLAEAIARQRGAHEVLVVLNDFYRDAIEPIRARFEGLLPADAVRVWHAAGPVRPSDPANAWRRTVAAKLFLAFVESLRPDVLHVSNLLSDFRENTAVDVSAAVPTAVTLYDLIPLRNPDSYLAPDPAFEAHYRIALTRLQRAAGWLAISDATARDGITRLGLDPERVFAVPPGADARFQPATLDPAAEAVFRTRLGIDRPFVLSVGGADARKNLDGLVRAFGALPSELRDRHQLVIVGKLTPDNVEGLERLAEAAGLRPGDIVCTGFVADDDLVVLYGLCAVFVFPSVDEGFGLPALEAMACGAPVIGADATSIPEVIGWPEALFDPTDPAAMTATMARALGDDAFRAELVERGLPRAETFSWDESGRRAIAAFERIGRVPSVGVDTDAAIQRLVGEIRALPGSCTDQDLLATARAIDRNLPG